MDTIIYILLLIIVLAIIIAIPILAAVLIFKYSQKKFPLSISYFIASIIPLIFAYFIYTAFYPIDSFFEEEFKIITKMNFPSSGEIIKKDASYPINKDYCSSALISFSEKDYENILNKINSNKNFVKGNVAYSSQLSYVTKTINPKDIKVEFYDSLEYHNYANHYYIGFLKDNRNIIIHLMNE